MALNGWALHRGLQPCPQFGCGTQIPRVVAGARRQQQSKKQRKKGSKPFVEDRISFEDATTQPSAYDQGDDDDDYELVNSKGVPILPRAPAPGDLKLSGDTDSGPDTPYPVFLPKASTVKSVQGNWSWEEDGERKNDGPPIPEWNPRTGFMGAPVQQQPLLTPEELQGAGVQGEGTQGATPAQQQQQPVPVAPQISLTTPSADAYEDLPAVTQSQVMTNCIGTSFWMTVLAFFLRAYAQANAPLVLGTDELQLSQYLFIPSGLDNWTNVGVLLGCAGVVTVARLQLLNVWEDFRVATERSNKQVLSPLNWVDILLVAVLTGVSEEVLFRGAIIPASFLDWRGVLLSGGIFGLLHVSGGRNTAFAAWAGAVGCLYGGAFIYTHNIWVPAAAHSIANFASAAVWKSKNRSGSS